MSRYVFLVIFILSLFVNGSQALGNFSSFDLNTPNFTVPFFDRNITVPW